LAADQTIPTTVCRFLVGAGIPEPCGADEAISTGLLYLGAVFLARLVRPVCGVGKE
jgi:hypothetical protein